MLWFKRKKQKDFISPIQEKREALGESLKELVDGKIVADTLIRKNITFVFFLTFIGIGYISNGYHAERMFMKKVALERELRELRFESISTASELTKLSMQSEIIKRIESEGLRLKESRTPPVKIKVKSRR